jgi:hypothetical protein
MAEAGQGIVRPQMGHGTTIAPPSCDGFLVPQRVDHDRWHLAQMNGAISSTSP